MFTVTETNRKWYVLTAMILLIGLLNIDFTAVNLALAPIAKDFHTDLSDLQWVINGYVMASAMLVLVAGRLGDIFGHRIVFLIGMSLFFVGSLLSGAAVNEQMLVVTRVIQGLGTALSFPMIYVITFKAFPEQRRGLALGIISAGVGISQALGPTVAGVLIELVSWRAIFYINVPVVLLSYWLTMKSCPKEPKPDCREKVDYLGVGIFAVGIFLLTLALNESSTWGVGSLAFLVTITLGIVLLAIFLVSQRYIKSPLMDISLFLNRSFISIVAVRFMFTIVFVGLLFMLGLFLQNILEFSAIKSGMVLLAMTGISGLIAPFAGRLIDAVGVKIPLILDMILLLLASVLLGTLSVESFNFYQFLAALFCVGMIIGSIFSASATGVMQAASEEKKGQATGILFTIVFIGSILGVACAGFVLSKVTHGVLQQLVAASHLSVNVAQLQQVALALKPITSLHGVTEKLIVKQAFMTGFTSFMLMSIGLAVVGLFFSFRIKR